jgi:hypothetical protein
VAVDIRSITADDTEQHGAMPFHLVKHTGHYRVVVSETAGSPYWTTFTNAEETEVVAHTQRRPLRYESATSWDIATGEASFSSLISGELLGGFRLLLPLSVNVWREGDEFVAEQPDIPVHAFGTTAEDALSELKAALVEQRMRLDQLGDQLSPRFRRERDLLRGIIVPDA